MANSRRSSGAWTTLTTRKRRAGGAWVDLTFIKRRISGAWTTVWSAVVSVSPSSLYVFGNRSTTTSTTLTGGLTAAGGSGSYNWSIVAGSGDISISASTGTSIVVSSTVLAGTTTLTKTGTVRCANASNAADYYDVPCTFDFIGTE